MPVAAYRTPGRTHENNQFDELVEHLYAYYHHRDEWVVALQTVEFDLKQGKRVEPVEIDALILKKNAFIIIDFKSFPDVHEVIIPGDETLWQAYRHDDPGHDNPIQVKGGSQKNPLAQVYRSRGLLKAYLLRKNKSLYDEYIKTTWEKDNDPDKSNFVDGIIWFDTELSIQSKMLTKRWFTICTGKSVYNRINAIHNSGLNIPDNAFKKFVSAFGYDPDSPYLPPSLSVPEQINLGTVANIPLPGGKPKSESKRSDWSIDEGPEPLTSRTKKREGPKGQFTNNKRIGSCSRPNRAKSSESSLVFYPVVSKDKGALSNLRSTTTSIKASGGGNPAVSYMNSMNPNILLSDIELTIYSARFHEIDRGQDVRVDIADAGIQIGNSYQLALALADKLCRFDNKLDETSKIVATGVVDKEGNVGAIKQFEQKCLLILLEAKQGDLTHFVFPEANNSDSLDLQAQIADTGVKLVPTRTIDELNGVLWQEAPSPNEHIATEQSDSVKARSSLASSGFTLSKFFLAGAGVAFVMLVMLMLPSEGIYTVPALGQPEEKAAEINPFSHIEQLANQYENHQTLDNLQTLIELKDSLDQELWQQLPPFLKNQLNRAVQDLQNSDTRLNTVYSLAQSDDQLSEQQQKELSQAYRKLQPLDFARDSLEANQLKNAQAHITDYYSSNLQQSVEQAFRIGSAQALQQLLSAYDAIPNEFAQRVVSHQPELHQKIVQAKEALTASNQRLRRISKAYRAYRENLIPDPRSETPFFELISSVNTLTNFDRQRQLNETQRNAIETAPYAAQQLKDSDNRLIYFINTANQYNKLMQQKQHYNYWDSLKKAYKQLQPFDLKRANRNQNQRGWLKWTEPHLLNQPVPASRSVIVSN